MTTFLSALLNLSSSSSISPFYCVLRSTSSQLVAFDKQSRSSTLKGLVSLELHISVPTALSVCYFSTFTTVGFLSLVSLNKKCYPQDKQEGKERDGGIKKRKRSNIN